jgi:transposase-like protein
VSAGAAPAQDQHGAAAQNQGKKATNPLCPYCGCEETHRSHRAGPIDYFLRWLSLLPYRCADCERRFHH